MGFFSETPPFSWLSEVHWPSEDEGGLEPDEFTLISSLLASGNSPVSGSATTLAHDAGDYAEIIRRERPYSYVDPDQPSPVQREIIVDLTWANRTYAYHPDIEPDYLYMQTADGVTSVSYTVTDLYPTDNMGQVDSGAWTITGYSVPAVPSFGLSEIRYEVISIRVQRDQSTFPFPHDSNHSFLLYTTFRQVLPPPGP